ncbi:MULTISPECIES: ribokinase [unclassified Pseudoclavibacter]|uniref:ribokinase n=1 Tax=unclassified Pseudoclavibacter TaxID=2615177 RepID=UPI000CE7FB85|nr:MULTISPECIES: ribokinase [unclassified Pseudoclavibacter]PPF35701.1 ribokinase [Pseudoclavibacter sp. AY1H1]PPG01785.1 ribokinase [Pseudoclavibacter sp. RFBI5]
MSGTNRSGVLVVGSVSADLTAFSARPPEPGETLRGDSFSLALGGKGANQAVAAARAGASTSFIACVGDDTFGTMVTRELVDAGVGVDRLRTVSGETGIAHIRVDASGENSIVIVPGANDALDEATVVQGIRDSAATSSVLLTQLETPARLTASILRTARDAGITTILDPAPAAPLDEEVWGLVDLVTPNETEARMLTGIVVDSEASAVEAGRWFLDRGVGAVLVTRGGDGTTLVTPERAETFPVIEVEAVDTTAAGDAFAGALGAALAGGRSLEASIRFGAAAGALAVSKRGASPSIPTAAEIEELLAS